MIEVRIAMTGTGWPIGSAVRVDLPAARQSAGLLVPRDAVIVRADGAHVYRVGKGDLAERIVGARRQRRLGARGGHGPPRGGRPRGRARGRAPAPGQAVKIAGSIGSKSAAAKAAPKG